MMHEIFTIVVVSLSGAVVSALLAALPIGSSIHVCGLLMLILANMSAATLLPANAAIALTVAVAVGYTMGSTIPALVFQCTDESSLYFPPLGNRVAADGELHHAVMYTGLGSITAITILLIISPFISFLLPKLHWLYDDYRGAIISLILICLVISLIHDSLRSSRTGRGKDAVRLGSGLVTIILSGMAGFIIYHHPITAVQTADMQFTPLFLGLWVIPWLVKNINNRPAAIKNQPALVNFTLAPKKTIFAILSGSFMGLATLVAAIAAPCAMAIAGWTLLRRERRLQLIGQSAARTMLIVGGALLIFVPNTHLHRGHFGWFFQRGVYAFSISDYTTAIFAMLLAAAIVFWLLSPMATIAIAFVRSFPRYLIPAISIVLITISVSFVFGLKGLVILFTGTFIGGFGLASGARRTSCLGAVLLPAFLDFIGIGKSLASVMGI